MWFKLSTITDILHDHISQASDIPMMPTVVFLLALHGTNVSAVAKRAGVTPQAGYADINNIKKSPRFRAEILHVLDCIPWDLDA